MSGYYQTIEPIRDPNSVDDITRFSEEVSDAIESIEKRGRGGVAQATFDYDAGGTYIYPVFVAPFDCEILDIYVTVNAAFTSAQLKLFSVDRDKRTTWIFDSAFGLSGSLPTKLELPTRTRLLRTGHHLEITIAHETAARRYLFTIHYREVHRGAS